MKYLLVIAILFSNLPLVALCQSKTKVEFDFYRQPYIIEGNKIFLKGKTDKYGLEVYCSNEITGKPNEHKIEFIKDIQKGEQGISGCPNSINDFEIERINILGQYAYFGVGNCKTKLYTLYKTNGKPQNTQKIELNNEYKYLISKKVLNMEKESLFLTFTDSFKYQILSKKGVLDLKTPTSLKLNEHIEIVSNKENTFVSSENAVFRLNYQSDSLIKIKGIKGRIETILPIGNNTIAIVRVKGRQYEFNLIDNETDSAQVIFTNPDNNKYPNSDNFYITDYIKIKNSLYVMYAANSEGYKILKSDGTSKGTSIIYNIESENDKEWISTVLSTKFITFGNKVSLINLYSGNTNDTKINRHEFLTWNIDDLQNLTSVSKQDRESIYRVLVPLYEKNGKMMLMLNGMNFLYEFDGKKLEKKENLAEKYTTGASILEAGYGNKNPYLFVYYPPKTLSPKLFKLYKLTSDKEMYIGTYYELYEHY
jgi:hypothetical protein